MAAAYPPPQDGGPGTAVQGILQGCPGDLRLLRDGEI